jgi:exodeoxyribonuclease V alpha subunit
LARVFGPAAPDVDRQRVAALLAVLGRFTVVTGGTGTGKTSTVVKLLALLVEQARGAGRRLRVALLAPTGKAAARLAESVQREKANLDVPSEVRAAIPEVAATIHRTLGVVPGSSTRFRYNAAHPLLVDVAVVDEASMVDVALMRRLVEALPTACRLILLGDRHQLASVEAGAVLGDLCGGPLSYSGGLIERLSGVGDGSWPERLPRSERPNALADCIVELDRSYRFEAGGSIGKLAAAVRAGDVDAALSLLGEPEQSVALVTEAEPERAVERVCAAATQGYAPFLRGSDAHQQLRAFSEFRILCAHRHGPTGVQAMNQAVEQTLFAAGLLDRSGPFYAGRPILITENDYQRGLFNGDVGIVVSERERGGRVRVIFPASDDSLRDLSPAELPAHETVFCMTIHKSQGSEFDQVAIVLPETDSPLLSRELFYTALTRARHRAEVFATPEVVRACVARRIERASGLRDTLWGTAR